MTISSLSCKTCGTNNPTQAAFCMACGTLIQPGASSPRNATGLLLQDQLLKQRYRIVTQIGQGGFAAVYRAEDRQLRNRPIAIKEMSQGGLSPEELVKATEAFKREAQLLASLQHPHLPHIYDHFSEGGRWYLVMDFLEGETLEEALLHRQDHRFSLMETLEIGVQLCSVLDYLHTCCPPIIFRDLKPSNIIFTSSKHLYLIDFGIARHFKFGQNTDTIPFGSPGYAAPEQYGKAQTTPKSDIYSLGVLLHQLLSGIDPSHKPFSLSPLGLYGSGELAELEGLITRMTAFDPEHRPTSIAEVQVQLHHLVAYNPTNRVGFYPQRRSYGAPYATKWSTSQEHFETRQTQMLLPSANHSRRRFVFVGLLAGITLSVGVEGFLSSLSGYHKSPANIVPVAPVHKPLQQQTITATATRIPPVTQQLFTYHGHTNNAIWSVAWSPQGNIIASAGNDQTVQVWRSDTGERLSLTNLMAVNAVAWSPDGNFLAAVDTLDGGGSVCAWNPLNGQPSFTYPVDNQGCWSVAYSPDGAFIAVGSYTGIRVLRVADGQVIFKDTSLYERIASQVRNIAWSSNNRDLAWVGAYFQEVRVWSRDTGATVSYPEQEQVVSMAWSPDGSLLVSGMQDGRVSIWDAARRSRVHTYLGHVDYVGAISWSPNGNYIASTGGDSAVCIWDPIVGNTLTAYPEGTTAVIESISWSPDSTRIVSGGFNQPAQVWKALP